MSIATALSSLRKRERAIRNSLASKGICTAPYGYDNDTSAIIDKIDSTADAKERLLKGLTQTVNDFPAGCLDEIDLRSVGLANGMVKISAFANSTVKSAILPSNCQSIDSIFMWCTQLSSFKFSWAKSVDKDTIASFLAKGAYKKLSGTYMLSGCSSLTAVPDFLPVVGSRQAYGLTGNNYIFAGCTGISSLDCAGLHIASTGVMPSYMFYGCSSLTGIEPGDIVPETANQGGTY